MSERSPRRRSPDQSSGRPRGIPHRALGAAGEGHAVRWLRRRGFRVLHRNYRRRYQGELDILACRDRELHLVEVKCGSRSDSGPGELMQRLDRRKLLRLLRTLEQWLAERGAAQAGYAWNEVLIDLLTVELNRRPPRIVLHENICPPELLLTDPRSSASAGIL